MRKNKEILRLKHELNLSTRQIAESLNISHSTVGDVLRRAGGAGLSWPLPEGLDDATLQAKLYPGNPGPAHGRAEPDLEWVHRELRRKGVTMQLLWAEYKQAHVDGYQYTQFCDRYNRWHGKLNLVLRQSHRAGEKTFLDYVGPTVPIVDPRTGEVHEAYVFVAVLGASSYTYAEATWSQDLWDWIGANCRAFEFFGGVTDILVPDNLKAGVTLASRYDPEVNRSYAEMAAHYGTVVIPTRPRKPRDKAKAEAGVLLVERWILAALRNRRFFSLAELNEAIAELLVRLNNQLFQKLSGSRRSLYETLDRPALRPLPGQRYELAEWKKAKANIDYHVQVEHNFYSVPHQLVHVELEVRLTGAVVEVFHAGKRVASHLRLRGKGQYSTDPQHRPIAHQKHLEWTPSRIIHWAGTVGPAAAQLVQAIMADRPHPEQGYRACLGILRLSNHFTPERLEAAAARAVAIGATTYRSVQSILQQGLDRIPLPLDAGGSPPTPVHPNVRGPEYYRQPKEGVQ
jgi:transposase